MLDDGTNPLIWDAACRSRPVVVVVGNEKGGVGKTTLAMHIAVALASGGHEVATIDADTRQGSLSRYLANRNDQAVRSGRPLAGPAVHVRLQSDTAPQARQELADALAKASAPGYVVIDTPAAFSALSQIAHANADLIITPVGDSFVDLDALAHVDVARRVASAPGAYTKSVWKQNNIRIIAGHRPAEWLVVRNRMSPLNARNKREITGLLQALAARIGFRPVAGLSERLIFRELFYAGLTIIDLAGSARRGPLTPSHAKAADEVGTLLAEVCRVAEEMRPAGRVTS